MLAIESIALTVLFVTTILCHLFYWRESLAYPFYFHVCLTISLSMLLLTIGGMILEHIEGYRLFGGELKTHIGLTYTTFNPFMLVTLTLLGLNYESTAAQENIVIIDTIYVYMSNMITIGLLMMICNNYMEDREERNSKKIIWTEIEEFYRVIKSNPQANIKNLANNSKFTDIGKVNFTADDSIYLDLHCGHEYMINQDDLPEDERQDCLICLSVLERGERVIDHPRCNHTYHQVCLLRWLSHGSKVARCPTCKSNTRIELLVSMMNNTIDVSVTTRHQK